MKRLFVFLFLLLTALLQAEIGYVEPWGKDARLKVESPPSFTPRPPFSLAAKIAEKVILFHQNVLTHIDGPRSHFAPTSSSYMLEAIRTHGFLKGYIMGCDRLLRENSETWHYRTKWINGKMHKWDPPPKH